MVDATALVAETARRHCFGEPAVQALWDALARGAGRSAQFSHPDLGGMGQWSGGMLQIGHMSDDGLKARVAAACADLAAAMASAPAGTGDTAATPPNAGQADWWPAGLGRPSATGAQEGSRYAVFPEACRLAIEQGGRVTLYDTGHHRIHGVAQQRSTCSALAFSSQTGPVALDGLRIVES